MATLAEMLPETTMRKKPRPRQRSRAESGAAPVLLPWLRAQSINVTRHAAALRPFKREEFGPGASAPSEGHIQSVNSLITKLREGLLKMSGTCMTRLESPLKSPPRADWNAWWQEKIGLIAGCRASRRFGISISSSSASGRESMATGS